MTRQLRPIPPAALPLQVWAEARDLPALYRERDELVEALRRGCPRSLRALRRRRALEGLQRDILAREARLAGLVPICKTEH